LSLQNRSAESDRKGSRPYHDYETYHQRYVHCKDGVELGLSLGGFLEGTHVACHPERSEGSQDPARDPSLRSG